MTERPENKLSLELKGNTGCLSTENPSSLKDFELRYTGAQIHLSNCQLAIFCAF